MSEWLLTLQESHNGAGGDLSHRDIARAQLRKVIREGEKPCKYHQPKYTIQATVPVTDKVIKDFEPYLKKKKECPECWQSLCREAGVRLA